MPIGSAAASTTSTRTARDVRLPLAGTRSFSRDAVAAGCSWQPSASPAAAAAVERAAAPVSIAVAEALAIERRLGPVISREARCRYEQAKLIAAMLDGRKWADLGYSCLRDYCTEQLGIQRRAAFEEARIARALERLPATRAAFLALHVHWTHLRLLTSVATAETDDAWLELARTRRSRELAELVKVARATEGRQRSAAEQVSFNGPEATTVDEEEEPLLRWSIACPRDVRQLWRAVLEIGSRVCGARIPPWKALEVAAAEAMSRFGRSPGASCTRERPPEPVDADAKTEEQRIRRFEQLHGASEGHAWLGPLPSVEQELPEWAVPLDPDADVTALDRRLRDIKDARQRIDGELGALLRIVHDRRLYEPLGFATFRLYVEGRLGISASRAFALVKVDRASQKSPELRRAYTDGDISWLAARALLPVMGSQHDQAWIARARDFTLRRVVAEVSWACDRMDDADGAPEQAPPPETLDVVADGLARLDKRRVQMRALPERDDTDAARGLSATIALRAPASVIRMAEDAIEACRLPGEMRWRAFERMLAHAFTTWMALPKHRDPIFARDNFLCTCPGCSRRAELEDHHIVFRSDLGSHARSNRTAVCAFHHRACIHERRVRVTGAAPDRLRWEMGCREGAEPLIVLLGERYVKR